MLGQVSISPRFFKNERENYSNVWFAFWRELFQNSVDAGATEISINRIESTNPWTGLPVKGDLISFSDNGCGMSARVLEDVYFKLGETTKYSEDTIGGFGKARILTCFSHHSYGIHTLDNMVKGEGSSYSIEKADYKDGCLVWVDVDTMNRYGVNADIYSALRNYLSLSQLNCRILSSIAGINDFNRWLYKRRFTRSLSFGKVYVNKSGLHQGYLITRVNGAPMFMRSIRARAQVVLEIDPHLSREALVSNRDSLRSEYQAELDRFVDEISVDTTSALKRRSPQITLIGSSSSFCTTISNKKSEKPDFIDMKNMEVGVDWAAGTSITVPYPPVTNNRGDVYAAHGPNSAFDNLIPSFLIHVDTQDPDLRKAAWLFNPAVKNGKYFGNTKRKLARLWYIACDWAIRGLLETVNQDSVAWRPGFLFSDNNAYCSKVEGLNHLLLNPVDTDGNIKFWLNSRESRVKMLVFAAHEATHIIYEYHDEDFANLKDSIFEYVMVNEKEIFREMNRLLKV